MLAATAHTNSRLRLATIEPAGQRTANKLDQTLAA
jgi:hypothetical protein